MATITFTGPNPADPSDDTEVSTVVSLPDQALLMAVAGICANHGWSPVITDPESGEQVANPTGPGVFAIQETLKFWQREGLAYQERLAVDEVKAQVAEAIAPLNAAIRITSK